MLCCTEIVSGIQNNFRIKQHVLPVFCKKKSFWLRFTCTTNPSLEEFSIWPRTWYYFWLFDNSSAYIKDSSEFGARLSNLLCRKKLALSIKVKKDSKICDQNSLEEKMTNWVLVWKADGFSKEVLAFMWILDKWSNNLLDRYCSPSLVNFLLFTFVLAKIQKLILPTTLHIFSRIYYITNHALK